MSPPEPGLHNLNIKNVFTIIIVYGVLIVLSLIIFTYEIMIRYLIKIVIIFNLEFYLK